MAIISQQTWDKFTEEEKERIYREYMQWQEEAETNPFFEGKISNMEDLFGKENLQSEPKIKTWEDVEKKHPEDFSHSNAPNPMFIPSQEVRDKLLKKVMAIYKIATLIELGYGGMVSEEEWRDENAEKWSVLYNHNFGDFDIVKMTKGYGWKSFISFHTKQQADEFMSYPENKELIKQYYMV